MSYHRDPNSSDLDLVLYDISIALSDKLSIFLGFEPLTALIYPCLKRRDLLQGLVTMKSLIETQ